MTRPQRPLAYIIFRLLMCSPHHHKFLILEPRARSFTSWSSCLAAAILPQIEDDRIEYARVIMNRITYETFAILDCDAVAAWARRFGWSH
jgi:hypothetical protein